jgi:hypothetical protein
VSGGGERFTALRGTGGDHLFVLDGQPGFHLSADLALLRCAPGPIADSDWQRALLDSVLFSVALLHGRELLHAAAVATPAGCVAITALSGGGKSTLASELVRRGHTLVADDVVAVSLVDDRIVAHPGPPTMTTAVDLGDAGGDPIANWGADAWRPVATTAGPEPLAAIVFLERRHGAPLRLEPLAPSLMRLLPTLLKFPRTVERERARFDLASAIGVRLPSFSLQADVSTPPAALAGALDELTTVARAA